ncbi:MAG: protein-L-isoaspartate(D-aspartate) O-methyltransferase [Thermodesulfobacteriota bacterium]
MLESEIKEMVRTIALEARLCQWATGIGKISPPVLEAMAQVPRHQFVPPDLRAYAYGNGPLPIGAGQTISQPYIVALMTDLLRPEEDDVILEVGCGSGYQAAILSLLVEQVHSLEIVPSLASEASERLAEMGFSNVEVRQGDGYQGLVEHAPFAGIIVTAAARHVPPPLLAQLKPGGRLVIPVGLPHGAQELLLFVKEEDGTVTSKKILDVAFVPLTGPDSGFS